MLPDAQKVILGRRGNDQHLLCRQPLPRMSSKQRPSQGDSTTPPTRS